MSAEPFIRSAFFRRILAVTLVLLTILALGSAEKMAIAGAGATRHDHVHPFAHPHRSDFTSITESAMILPLPNAALNFDGNNDIVDSGDISALNGVSQYTIETWVKFDSISIYETVFSKRITDNDRAAMLQFWDNNGNIAVAVDLGYGHTTTPLTTGRWYHIAVVYDGTQATNADRLKLYVDGLPQPLTFLFGDVPASTSTTNSRFTLGAEYNSTTPVNAGSSIFVPFDGTIDEVRIWNVARTQLQIQTAKGIELTGSESGLELYYNFNEGLPNSDNSGLTTLTDKAGTAQNGTLWNFTLNGTSSNWVGGAFDVYPVYVPIVIRNN